MISQQKRPINLWSATFSDYTMQLATGIQSSQDTKYPKTPSSAYIHTHTQKHAVDRATKEAKILNSGPWLSTPGN